LRIRKTTDCRTSGRAPRLIEILAIPLLRPPAHTVELRQGAGDRFDKEAVVSISTIGVNYFSNFRQRSHEANMGTEAISSSLRLELRPGE
jgi:hypothetical protein